MRTGQQRPVPGGIPQPAAPPSHPYPYPVAGALAGPTIPGLQERVELLENLAQSYRERLENLEIVVFGGARS